MPKLQKSGPRLLGAWVAVTSTAGAGPCNGRSSDGAQRPRAGSQGPSRVAPGGKRRGGAGVPRAGIGFGGGSAPSTPPRRPPDTPGSRSQTPAVLRACRGRCRRRSLSGAGAGQKSVRGSFPARSCGCGGGPGKRGGWTSRGPQQARPAAPGRARLLCRPRRKVRPPCRARGRRDAVPARLPEDHLRVPATGGCDSGLPGDSGPRAAGAPGRVTRSLPPAYRGRCDLSLLAFSCHCERGGERVSVTPPFR